MATKKSGTLPGALFGSVQSMRVHVALLLVSDWLLIVYAPFWSESFRYLRRTVDLT